MLIIKMCKKSVALFVSVMMCSSLASVVKFLPTTSFNLPISFKDGKLPCSRETVVFPETLLASVTLESEIAIKEFILPKEGDINLADGIILFGADDNDLNCTHDGNVYYLEKSVVTWSQPNIWSSSKFNDATPDEERMPCFDDIVEFPSNSEFTLTLPNKNQFVAGMKFGNYNCRTINACRKIFSMSDSKQKFILNKFYTTGIGFKQQSCMSRSGCPCQKYPLSVNCEYKVCSVPACVDPIKPEGHCCKICGGVIKFDIDQTFDIMMFKELVDETVESYGIESLIYHLGRLPNDKVQLVVIDKAEYSGTSAVVVNAIYHQMKHSVQGTKFVGVSGRPLDKTVLGGTIFVSMFFLVVFVMGLIYIYYYKLSEVFNVRFPIVHRTAPAVFSRFQTRTDSVVCLTRRDSETVIGRRAGTAFRNPLYDSTRQREELKETDVNN